MKSIFKSMTMGGVSMSTVGIILSAGLTDTIKGNLVTIFGEESRVVLVVGPWLDLTKEVGAAVAATGVVTSAIGTVKRPDIFTPKWCWGNNKPEPEPEPEPEEPNKKGWDF